LTDPRPAEAAAWLAGRADRVIETSCAWVFLAGPAAFKIKRPVDFGFLDFTTLERRRWAIERELDFNRRTAPDIYRAVRRLTRRMDGGLELDGVGEVVEYVLEMRRFDETAVLSEHPDAVDGPLAEALGRTIARFHADAPVRPDSGGAAGLRYTIESNAEMLRELSPPLEGERIEGLIAATDEEFRRREGLLETRRSEGFARRCHGDLHLGNLLLEDGRPVLFDCIEFNDRLSEIDVQYDLAFLLMDLDIRGRRDAATRALSAYLDEAARSFPDDLWDGLAALPLMLSVRAAVRAHVSANAADARAAAAYLDAALAHLSPAPPRLTAVGGLSGTGKTGFARRIAPVLGASPGAVVMRSDEVRKRMLGRPPHETLPPEAYERSVTDRVFETLFAEAERALRAGRAVVLDATFMRPGLRERVEALGRAVGVRFDGVWLEADPGVLAARVAARSGDASDATIATLRAQLDEDLGEIGWTRLDAGGPPDAAASAWIGEFAFQARGVA
jgi:aminoglycoside phosphotransferase family enzyme/predicted kinase